MNNLVATHTWRVMVSRRMLGDWLRASMDCGRDRSAQGKHPFGLKGQPAGQDIHYGFADAVVNPVCGGIGCLSSGELCEPLA